MPPLKKNYNLVCKLTRQSGILDLFECGDSVMADRGFDIEDDLVLRGINLTIPPFLRNKKQFSEKNLVVTHHIASLRILVERAMIIFLTDHCRTVD